MIRVVLDTNVYVSAINYGGAPEEVLRLAENGFFELRTSSFIVNEVRRVLASKFSWSNADLAAVESLLQLGTMVTPRTRLTIVQDPDDNRILECALASNARYLITGDNHLLRIGQFKTTQILTSRSFLAASPWI